MITKVFAAVTPSPAVDFNKFQQAIFGTPGPGGSPSPFADINTASLGLIVSELLKYLFPFTGLLLFIYLLIGGFSYLTSGGEPKAMEQAQSKITNAIVGFIIVFVAYWVVQIFEFMFGISGSLFSP